MAQDSARKERDLWESFQVLMNGSDNEERLADIVETSLGALVIATRVPELEKVIQSLLPEGVTPEDLSFPQRKHQSFQRSMPWTQDAQNATCSPIGRLLALESNFQDSICRAVVGTPASQKGRKAVKKTRKSTSITIRPS